MKKLVATLLYFILIIQINAQGNSQELVEDELKRYPNESGQVLYEISGDANGTARRSWSHWGWKETSTRELTFELYGMKNLTSSLDARDGDIIYSADLTSKKGQQIKDLQTSGLLRYKSDDETRDAIYTASGGVLARQDTILGKPVNIWKYETGKNIEVWEWKGIILKNIRKLANITYTITATSIEVDVKNEVVIPEGITWSTN